MKIMGNDVQDNTSIDEALEALDRIKEGEFVETGQDCFFVCPKEKDVETVRQALERRPVPEGWKLVPWQPTEDQWGGLARTLMMWIDMSGKPNGAALYSHLRNLRITPPQWLMDEIPDTDHVPPKGTRAAVIYKAMLAASPEPVDD